MAFADFGVGYGDASGVTKRHYASPGTDESDSATDADGTNPGIRRGNMERETGFEPATLSLGTFVSETVEFRLTV
jgi:hypothetical protein